MVIDNLIYYWLFRIYDDDDDVMLWNYVQEYYVEK